MQAVAEPLRRVRGPHACCVLAVIAPGLHLRPWLLLTPLGVDTHLSHLRAALASTRGLLQALSPLVHEVCAENETAPAPKMPSWAQEAMMERPHEKNKSEEFLKYVPLTESWSR